MAASEDVSSILRQPSKGLGKRRLPGRPGVALEAVAEAPMLDQLRQAFAAELDELRARAWQEGLDAARAEAATELAGALHKSASEQTTLLLKKEQALEKNMAAQCARLESVLVELKAGSERVIGDLQGVVARLAYAVLLKLLGRHQASRSLVADLAAHAVDEYRLAGPLRIRVAAEDHASIVASGIEASLLATLQVDHDLPTGSCWIDYGKGVLDASLDAQLSALRDVLGLPADLGDAHVAGA